MSANYTADEIFEIAENIEREGERFYRDAAAATKDEAAGLLFLELAAAEADHLETLRRLRKKAVPSADSLLKHPDEAVSLYLKIVAGGTVFPQRSSRGPGNETEVLSLAINKELDSILYYYSLKDLLAGKGARSIIDTILEAERDHVVRLATCRDMRA